MARIRTIKPEFWSDEKIGPLEAIDRFVFLGLIGMADDMGRVLDNIKQIDAFIFPYTDETSRHSIDKLEGIKRLRRGKALSGLSIIQLNHWHHQKIDRPNFASCLPAIDGEEDPVLKEYQARRRGLVEGSSINRRRIVETSSNTTKTTESSDSASSDIRRSIIEGSSKDRRNIVEASSTHTMDHGSTTMDHGSTTMDQGEGRETTPPPVPKKIDPYHLATEQIGVIDPAAYRLKLEETIRSKSIDVHAAWAEMEPVKKATWFMSAANVADSKRDKGSRVVAYMAGIIVSAIQEDKIPEIKPSEKPAAEPQVAPNVQIQRNRSEAYESARRRYVFQRAARDFPRMDSTAAIEQKRLREGTWDEDFHAFIRRQAVEFERKMADAMPFERKRIEQEFPLAPLSVELDESKGA